MSTGASGAVPAAAVHLIPVDEGWMAMLRQIEEPLLFHLVDAGQDDEWRLPHVLRGEVARDAWWRIFQAVRAAFAEAEHHRLLAAAGTYELAQLAVVEIAGADLEVLNKVAIGYASARAGVGGAELAELLADLEPEPQTIGGANTGAVQALVHVVNTLCLPPDGDMRLLVELVRRGIGADVVLAPAEEDAYRRYVRRWVARMGR
jgi:hypothetical protein